jgi:hypothetical protein
VGLDRLHQIAGNSGDAAAIVGSQRCITVSLGRLDEEAQGCRHYAQKQENRGQNETESPSPHFPGA